MKKLLFYFITSIAVVVFFGINRSYAEKIISKNQLFSTVYAESTATFSDQKQVTQNPNLGIGPVKKVTLGAIDGKLVEEGKNIFNNKCTICHDLDVRKVGPALRNITKERTPEYFMNMMVNYAQMLKEDPVLKDQFRKFNGIPMTNPELKQTQARALLEYLRSVAK